jgi:hypothetical protein
MTINIKPETERLVQEELRRGNFDSVDELIVESVMAWRQIHASMVTGAEQRNRAIDDALAFARNRAIPIGSGSIKDLIHEGHRM